MKKTNKILALFVMLAMVITLVRFNSAKAATEHGTGTYMLTVFVDESGLQNGSVESIEVNESAWASNDDVFRTTNGQNTIEFVVDAQSGYEINLIKGGNSNAIISAPTVTPLTNGNRYTYTVTYNTSNQNDNLSLYPSSRPVGSNPPSTSAGLTIRFIGSSGSVWYKFGNNTETKITSPTTTPIAIAGDTLTLRIEDKTTGAVFLRKNGADQGVDKEQFKTGYTVNVASDEAWEFEVEYVDGGSGGQTPSSYEDISLNATFNNTFGEIILNNLGSARTPEGASYRGTFLNAGYTDSTKTNQITINTSLSEPYAKRVTVNGRNYDFTDNRDSHTIEVAGASSYTIVVEGNPSVVTPKTIIWTNPDYKPTDEEDAAWVSTFSIGHGSAKVIAVYDEDNNLVSPSQYVVNSEAIDNGGVYEGFGHIAVIPGSRVVFEFVPEYGYQLTSISINEQPIEATATMNRFEFTMPRASGNVHFSATFSKTDDIVKANSEKVSSGTIDLGNALEGGTAQLMVNDVELASDKISGFEKAAGEYTISNYLDIDLYNVFYKGKNDADDVWSNKINELEKEATVSIKLEDGVTADDIVIVHNIHDGDEYEVIEIQSYDQETNTITFKTKSFSSYAIATKGDGSNASSKIIKGTKTGDNVLLFVSIAVIALVGMFVAIKIRKKNKK